ncbi:MAG: membrane dipeptidase [Acidimicrobiia bacterium]|nr:membrane dipeptidase [Acidimicrobiia bacterium]
MTSHKERARQIHDSLPVVDGHNDLPWALRLKADSDLSRSDPRESLPDFHTDFGRMRDGGVGAQFWSVFVPAWTNEPFKTTMEQVSLVKAMTALSPDTTEMATSASHAEAIIASGRMAGLMGAEGGHAIEDSLDNLEALATAGVRYMTLTHGSTISWADSATDQPEHGGLTSFGKRVVTAMNEFGMLVDISHVSADTMRDAIRTSTRPVIASHSSAYAIASHPRNVPDDVLHMVGDTGGVVMVTFVPGFLVQDGADMSIEMFEEQRQLRGDFGPDEEAAYQEAAAELLRSKNLPRGDVGAVVDHIEHIADLIGVEHVGIGSDFDGVPSLPVGLEDASTYPHITEEMLRRGWNESDIRMVLGQNALRVLAASDV